MTSTADAPHPSPRMRLLVALAFALVAAALAWYAEMRTFSHGGDHYVLWNGAREVWAGIDPYHIAPSGKLPPVDGSFFYPLPAVLLSAPFMWLSPEVAAIAFVVLSSAAFGFAITRDGFSRLPVLLSVPFLLGAYIGQSTPAVTAAALLPGFGFLLVTKPSIGLPLWLWRPSRSAVIGGAVICALSLVLIPRWPFEWYKLASHSPAHFAPVRFGFGSMGLLAALRWRDPDARLLVAMTLIPHGPYFYDDLPLWLIPRTAKESLMLTAMSWVAFLVWQLLSLRMVFQSELFGTLVYPVAAWIILRRPVERRTSGPAAIAAAPST